MVVGLGLALFAMAVMMWLFGLVLPKEIVRRDQASDEGADQ